MCSIRGRPGEPKPRALHRCDRVERVAHRLIADGVDRHGEPRLGRAAAPGRERLGRGHLDPAIRSSLVRGFQKRSWPSPACRRQHLHRPDAEPVPACILRRSRAPPRHPATRTGTETRRAEPQARGPGRVLDDPRRARPSPGRSRRARDPQGAGLGDGVRQVERVGVVRSTRSVMSFRASSRRKPVSAPAGRARSFLRRDRRRSSIPARSSAIALAHTGCRRPRGARADGRRDTV